MRTESLKASTRSFVWSVLCLLLMPSAPCRAAHVDGCFYFQLASSDVTGAILRQMKLRGDRAARVCLSKDGAPQRYYSATSVWAPRPGVCVFRLVERSMGSQGVDKEPYTFMALGAQKCPPLGSPEYIESEGITAGTFAELVGLWNGMTRSQQLLDAAFSEFHTSDPLEAGAYKKIRQDFLVRHPKLMRIEISPAASPFLSRHSGFRLVGQSDGSRAPALVVDLTSSGLKVFAVELIAY